jgi:integrase
VRWGLVARNVADAADPPRVPRREQAVWSAEELRVFLGAACEDRLAAMWLLFATTGMRRSELLGLLWRAVDLQARPGRLAVVQTVVVVDKRPVVVAEAKTATSRRQLALDLFTVAALKAHHVRQLEERLAWGPAWTEAGLVFTREDGQVLHPEHVTKRFARLVRDAGLPTITLHGVRHSYATGRGGCCRVVLAGSEGCCGGWAGWSRRCCAGRGDAAGGWWAPRRDPGAGCTDPRCGLVVALAAQR